MTCGPCEFLTHTLVAHSTECVHVAIHTNQSSGASHKADMFIAMLSHVALRGVCCIVLDLAKILSLCLDLQLLMVPLIMSALYVWCQLNRDTMTTFLFGIRFKVSGHWHGAAISKLSPSSSSPYKATVPSSFSSSHLWRNCNISSVEYHLCFLALYIARCHVDYWYWS